MGSDRMKKAIVGITLVGAVVFLCVWFINSPFAMVSVKEKREFDVENIEMLSFQTSAADIEIISSSSEQIMVKLEGKIDKKLKNKLQMKITEDGGRLKVSYLPNDKNLGIRFGSMKNMTLSVTLPEKTYKELLVHTTSGNIDAVGVSARIINLVSTSGDQDIKNFKSDETLTMQSTSGDIEVDRIMMNNFSIKLTSGNVKIDELSSGNGKITTTSGNVRIIIEEMVNSLNVMTTSGDVKTTFKENPKSLKIKFQGSSGEPDIKLKGIMYEDKSENSAVGVIGDGSKTLTVKTTSGDFTAE